MFDPRRFRLLAVAQFSENWRTYAWFLGIGIIVHFVLLLVLTSGSTGYRAMSTDGQTMVYLAGLFATAPLFAARYFQPMSRRESSLLVLMRPASILEKWLLALLVVAVAYPLAYTLAYYVCNVPAWLLASSEAAAELARIEALPEEREKNRFLLEVLQPGNFVLFLPWPESARTALGVLLPLTALQAFAVLGSLYFRSVAIIKTAVTGFLILLAAMLVAGAMESNPDRFFGYWWHDAVDRSAQSFLMLATWLGAPALLWLGCLFALQEREVA